MRRYSHDEIEELWARRRAGESQSSIAAALKRHPSSVFGRLARCGGIAPPPRVRNARQLQLAEREEISRGLVQGWSLAAMARALGRPVSTVSREVARNGGRDGYRAAQADAAAWDRARRARPCRLAAQPLLCQLVAEKLAAWWSPEQIAGWLRSTYPARPELYVSPETIYRTLFVQSRGALKRELVRNLRRGQPMRQPRGQASRAGVVQGLSIRERPAEAADRAVPGHWEGDLLEGGGHSCIVTLVERRSRYVLLGKTTGKDTQSVIRALTAQIQGLPRSLRQSLTWDRGSEMVGHPAFTIATDVPVYFCDPHSPWQRGSNENTNGLLRQYFPKGTDLSGYTQAQLDAVAESLNTRPRKTLGFRTPAVVLAASVAMTG